jgi:hypothetical protein
MARSKDLRRAGLADFAESPERPGRRGQCRDFSRRRWSIDPAREKFQQAFNLIERGGVVKQIVL